VHLAEQGEVWWFYPSGSSNENDRYVVWCYRESVRLGRNVWNIGELSRLGGSGRGVFPNPLMVDGSGYLYEHEIGWDYGGATPYLETGPFEIGQGDYMAEVQRVIPDQLADNDVTATFYKRMYPNSAESVTGPVSLKSPTSVMFQAAEVRVRYTGATMSDFRVGAMRFDVIRGDPL